MCYNQIMDSSKIAKMLGKIGGEKTMKKYGTEHYRKMGIKSAEIKKIAKQSQNIPILTTSGS